MNTAEEAVAAEWLAMVEAQPVDTFVYTYRDAGGVALYVGCTGNLHRRETQHRSQSQWFGLAATRTEVGPYRREIALAVEARTIAAEKPAHNTYRTSGYSGPGSASFWQRVSDLELSMRLADPGYGRRQDAHMSETLDGLLAGTGRMEPATSRPKPVELSRRRRMTSP